MTAGDNGTLQHVFANIVQISLQFIIGISIQINAEMTFLKYRALERLYYRHETMQSL